jgi:thiol-disulfide isomerase/thioredoxin
MSSHLLEFYGTECPHCIDMHVLVERLEKEEGIKVEALEVWHNKENEAQLLELDKDMCGGVPFFYNEQTKKFICGQTSYEILKKWAKGEPFTQEDN